jgi:hypothetical protein
VNQVTEIYSREFDAIFFRLPPQVRERIEILGPGGGFVFCTIHNAQANTPIENLLAMFDLVSEYR